MRKKEYPRLRPAFGGIFDGVVLVFMIKICVTKTKSRPLVMGRRLELNDSGQDPVNGTCSGLAIRQN